MEKILHILSHWSEPEFLTRYSEYLLIIIVIYSFLEVVFPPVPGDTLLILSGSLAGYMDINLVWIVISAFTGSFLGSVVLYKFGLRMEHRMLGSPKYSRILDSGAFTKIEKWLNRYGYWTLLISRFIPVCRSGIILVAGMVRLDEFKSLISVGVSIIITSTLLVTSGRFIGRRWEDIYQIWDTHFRGILMVLAGLIIFCFFLAGVRKYLARKRETRKDE